MIVNERFILLKNVPNILDLSKKQIQGYTFEDNSPKHVYVTLELKKNIIRHFGFEKILDYVKNVKSSKDLSVLVMDQYPLVASYNRKTKGKIINLHPFNAKELGRVSYLNLYASLVYAYAFEKLVTKKVQVPDNMADVISNFLRSFFLQVFGRDYGLVGTYSNKIPGLNFLILVYILVAFFGRSQSNSTYQLATKTTGYLYKPHLDILNQVDFSNIHGLIKSLNAMEITPGLNIVKFTTKIHTYFKQLQILPAFEDGSRFLCFILVSSIGGQQIAPSFISKYNEAMYKRMLDFMQKRIF